MISINISDLHFGAMDPKEQYEYLITQCLCKVKDLKVLDFFCIQGDIFDRKFMANNDAIMYASKFIEQVLSLCIEKNALLILLSGTSTHDANQLKLFYHLMSISSNIVIVESPAFVIWNRYKVLCIPELYGLPEETYTNLLYNSGIYDMAILHGTVKNSIYGYDEPTLNSDKHPVFHLGHFYNCKGPIMCGHVHVSTCLQKHIYYTGSPYRWKFGEEQPKGFMVCVMDDNTYRYYVHFEPIECTQYFTRNLDDKLNLSAEELVEYIKNLKFNSSDYLKVKFTKESAIISIIKDYFKNNPRFIIDAEDLQYQRTIRAVEQESESYVKYGFLLDPNISNEEKLVRYINMEEGREVITIQEFTDIMNTL